MKSVHTDAQTAGPALDGSELQFVFDLSELQEKIGVAMAFASDGSIDRIAQVLYESQQIADWDIRALGPIIFALARQEHFSLVQAQLLMLRMCLAVAIAEIYVGSSSEDDMEMLGPLIEQRPTDHGYQLTKGVFKAAFSISVKVSDDMIGSDLSELVQKVREFNAFECPSVMRQYQTVH